MRDWCENCIDHFVELDKELEREAGLSTAEIFESPGTLASSIAAPEIRKRSDRTRAFLVLTQEFGVYSGFACKN